jgi:hypothetical protein
VGWFCHRYSVLICSSTGRIGTLQAGHGASNRSDAVKVQVLQINMAHGGGCLKGQASDQVKLLIQNRVLYGNWLHSMILKLACQTLTKGNV